MAAPRSTVEIFSWVSTIRRKWQRLQRPGPHWFFLLYLTGLMAITIIAGLLKFAIKML